MGLEYFFFFLISRFFYKMENFIGNFRVEASEGKVRRGRVGILLFYWLLCFFILLSVLSVRFLDCVCGV